MSSSCDPLLMLQIPRRGNAKLKPTLWLKPWPNGNNIMLMLPLMVRSSNPNSPKPKGPRKVAWKERVDLITYNANTERLGKGHGVTGSLKFESLIGGKVSGLVLLLMSWMLPLPMMELPGSCMVLMSALIFLQII